MPKPVLTASQEAELIAGLKSSSRSAFEELYERYAPALLGILTKMVKHETQAQDLLQDSLIKVWKNIHRHDPAKGRLFTWLLQVTRNTARDYLKSPHRTWSQDLDSVLTNPQLDSQASFQPSFACIGFQQQVVATLPAKHGQIIELLYFHGYTQQEVAQLLNLPLGTVKTWTRSALGQLKRGFLMDQEADLHAIQPYQRRPLDESITA